LSILSSKIRFSCGISDFLVEKYKLILYNIQLSWGTSLPFYPISSEIYGFEEFLRVELPCEKYKAYGKEKVPNFAVRDYLRVRCEDGFKC
jgi:hypothetical protein